MPSEYPIKLGSLLFTLVEPERGHEVEYNRWYERDHFYAGCQIGAWNLAGTRFVATRECKAKRYPADSPLSLDGEELRKRTNDNPVFYVQYAHARTCNVTRLAGEDGVHLADGFDPSLLTHDSEAALLAILGDFPRIVAQAARMREPHRVPRYLEDLAGRYHKWYDDCRVRPRETGEEITDLHRTRLWLNEATRVVLANGLGLLGVSAPERL